MGGRSAPLAPSLRSAAGARGLAKKKAPKHGPNRVQVESLLSKLERAARRQAERRPRGQRSLRRFAMAENVRKALDRGGETAAAAVLAFWFCADGEILEKKYESVDRATQTRLDSDLEDSNRGLEDWRLRRFEELNVQHRDFTKRSICRLVAVEELNTKLSDPRVGPLGLAIEKAIRRAKRRAGKTADTTRSVRC